MTTSMSSVSNGIQEASSPSEQRQPLPRDQQTTPKSHPSSYLDRSPGEDDERRTAGQFNGPNDYDRADRRVSRSKGFLLDSSTRRHNLEDAEVRLDMTKSSSQATTPSKGKSRASRRSLLGKDVMNMRDEKMVEQNGTRYEETPVDEVVHSKHTIQANTDQAQIVSLALNLSESRRRNFSSNRVPAMNDTNMRVTSKTIASPLLGTPSSTTSQPRQLQSPSARSSADTFLSTPNSRLSQASSYSPGRTDFDSYSPPQVFRLSNSGAQDFSPSEATLLRVQKAKESLELLYEYRRLLQYLPKLPTGSTSRIQSGSKANTTRIGDSVLGREYNTLQYIRNRKIRRRENKPLNATGQGWRHVNAVRQWVDDVSDEREKRVSSMNNQYPLPQFPLNTNKIRVSGHDQDIMSNGSGTSDGASREMRPRVDWMIEPWNLLADAYWLEQSNNKQLIEDSKSHKIFPLVHSAPIDLRKEAVRASARRSLSIPRSVRNSNSIGSLELGKQDGMSTERGRQLHQRHHSIDSGRGISGSRDRKGAWRRLMGSQSASSAEESVPGAQQNRLYRVDRMSMKERQDRLILERQLTELMAKQSRTERHDRDYSTDTLFDDQTFNGMSSRPSSPEEITSNSPEKDLSSYLGLMNRTREMQPRRFSVNLGTQTDNTLDSPSIAINVSPPRSRSRDIKRSNNASGSNVVTPLSNSEDEAKLSPKTAHKFRRSSDAGAESKPRNSKDFESRLRGLLKGTKIIDKVSQPVAKVGDLMRRRDDQSQNLVPSPTASIYDASDLEDLAVPEVANGKNYNPPQSTGQYRGTKLPTFSSPFRDRQRGRSIETATDTNTSDHVVPTSNGTGLTIPQASKLETAPPSPVLQSIRSPEKTRSVPEHTTENAGSRQGSTQRRYAITKIGGSMTPTHPAIAQKQVSWPERDGLRWLNVTQRLLSPSHHTIYPKDIAVLRAFTECALQVPNNILHQTQGTTDSTKPNYSRSVYSHTKHRLQSSHSFLKEISKENTVIKTNLSTISQTTIPEIHSSLIDIETHIIENLTPVVRIAGDNADKLSAELATTRTLEVKRLNDELDFISRRRRRKFRWLRRGMYWSLEWTLLGLMWWAWLIVVCLRLTRGVFRMTRALGAWLFWL